MLPRCGLWLSLLAAEVHGLGARGGPGSSASICAQEWLGQASPEQCACTGTIYYGSSVSGKFASLTVFGTSIPCSATLSDFKPPPFDFDPAPLENKTCYCDPAPYDSVALPVLCGWHGFFATIGTMLTLAPHALWLLGKSKRVTNRFPGLLRLREDKEAWRNVKSVSGLGGAAALFCAWVPAYMAFAHSTPDFSGCWVLRRNGAYSEASQTMDYSDIQRSLGFVTTNSVIGLAFWLCVVTWKVQAILRGPQDQLQGGSVPCSQLCPTLTKLFLALLANCPASCQQCFAQVGWLCLTATLTALMHASMFPIARYKWFVNPSCPAPALPPFLQIGALQMQELYCILTLAAVGSAALAQLARIVANRLADRDLQLVTVAVDPRARCIIQCRMCCEKVLSCLLRATLLLGALMCLSFVFLLALVIAFCDHLQTGFEAYQSFRALVGLLPLPVFAWFSCALCAVVEGWQLASGLFQALCCCDSGDSPDSSGMELQGPESATM